MVVGDKLGKTNSDTGRLPRGQSKWNTVRQQPRGKTHPNTGRQLSQGDSTVSEPHVPGAKKKRTGAWGAWENRTKRRKRIKDENWVYRLIARGRFRRFVNRPVKS